MKKVELVSGVNSSILGFGCAPILGAIDGGRAQRAIDVALDCGVTHFDLARSYGFGEAERFVGKVLGSRRRDVTIATKFGIRANWKAKVMAPLKPLVRSARGLMKKQPARQGSAAQDVVRSSADRFHDRVPISEQGLSKSFEESLRALGVDYVDILFVHEPPHTIGDLDAVVSCADRLKMQGKVRGFGLAFPWSDLDLHKDYLERFDILQVNNSPGADHYDHVKHHLGDAPSVFFSPLRGAKGDAGTTLSRMWEDFPNSVILCSMFKEEHIRKNAQIAESIGI